MSLLVQRVYLSGRTWPSTPVGWVTTVIHKCCMRDGAVSGDLRLGPLQYLTLSRLTVRSNMCMEYRMGAASL